MEIRGDHWTIFRSGLSAIVGVVFSMMQSSLFHLHRRSLARKSDSHLPVSSPAMCKPCLFLPANWIYDLFFIFFDADVRNLVSSQGHIIFIRIASRHVIHSRAQNAFTVRRKQARKHCIIEKWYSVRNDRFRRGSDWSKLLIHDDEYILRAFPGACLHLQTAHLIQCWVFVYM